MVLFLFLTDLVVGGDKLVGGSLIDNVQYTCPGLNCTITNVQPNYPWSVINPSACIFTYPNGTTCFFEGVYSGPTIVNAQMYRICSNNWNWTPVGSETSAVVEFWQSYICDQGRGLIAYPSDGIIQIFNMSSLTWIREQSPGLIDPNGLAISQSQYPAACMSGDGKYYSFGGWSSVYILQWDPITKTAICFGTMPDVASATLGSTEICCVAVPGQANLIFVTLDPEIYGYDFAIFDISANPTGGNCNQGAWYNKTLCRNLLNYNNNLKNRDCSTCSGNILLSPGVNFINIV
jgi:hypothetical protein